MGKISKTSKNSKTTSVNRVHGRCASVNVVNVNVSVLVNANVDAIVNVNVSSV